MTVCIKPVRLFSYEIAIAKKDLTLEWGEDNLECHCVWKRVSQDTAAADGHATVAGVQSLLH